MAWATLSVTQVISEGGFSADEKATLDGLAGASAVTLADTLANVIQTIRGVVTARGSEVDAAGTIPDSFRMDAVAIVRWRWLISFSSMRQMQTEERKQAAERAEDRLDAIAEGDRSVDPIAGAPASAIGGMAGGQVYVPMVRHDPDSDYNAA